jgi:hypothetical protein
MYALLHLDPNKTIYISYEEFSSTPLDTIKRLNKKFSLAIPEENINLNIMKEQETSHRFAGNLMTRGNKFTGFKYDQSRKRRMPLWKQWVLTVLCRLPNKLRVYSQR